VAFLLGLIIATNNVTHVYSSDRWRAVVNAVMNLRVLKKAGDFLSCLGRVSFSGRTLLHGIGYVRSFTTSSLLASSSGFRELFTPKLWYFLRVD
jgi:hypothetical protein